MMEQHSQNCPPYCEIPMLLTAKKNLNKKNGKNLHVFGANKYENNNKYIHTTI